MVTVLAEMANIERSNIQYRLNSGRANYIAKGGKLGKKTGSSKTDDKKKEEYKEVIALLRKGYSIRNIAKLQSIGISTVQRIKNQVYKAIGINYQLGRKILKFCSYIGSLIFSTYLDL